MLKIFYSSLNSIASDGLLKSLKNRDKSKRHIIITPDRASLSYEKKLFSVLGESSFFDVQTTTLSRFCNNIIKKTGRSKKILSMMSGVALVKKILLEQKDNLKAFKKNVEFKNFASDIYNIICMFKSNNATPISVLKEGASSTLRLKLADLDLIYNEYEKYLQSDFMDVFNRLTLCKTLISKQAFKDTCVYFVQFDDFTKQAYGIIEKLVQCSEQVAVATTFAKSNEHKRNGNIYVNNIFYDLVSMAKMLNISYDIIEVKPQLSEEFLHLNNNAFGYKCNILPKPSSAIKVLKFDTFEQEITGIASKIKYEIINGAKYNDYCILVPNLKNKKNIIEKCLNKFELPYFMDESECIKNNIICRYLLGLSGLFDRISKNELLSLLKSPFACCENSSLVQYEDFITRYGLEGHSLLYTKDNVDYNFLLPFKKLIDGVGKKHPIHFYIRKLNDFLQETNFSEKLDELLKVYFDANDVLEYRKLENVKNKVTNIFDEMQNVMADYLCSPKVFYEIFEGYLESNSITMPPLLADSVFVGDVVNSYVDKHENIYICCANEGELPAFSSDDGILTDAEIAMMGEEKLNPTVQLVNKKSKFKLFEMLFSATKSLTFTFHTRAQGNDCYLTNFVIDIVRFMNINIVNAGLHFNQIENNMLGLNKQNILFNNLNKQTSIESLLEMIKLNDIYCKNKNYITLISSLKQSVENDQIINNYNFNNAFKNVKGSQLFFANGKCGVSEFENFYRCPYMHFVDYGLHLKPKEDGEVRPLEIGNIIHEFLKIALPLLLKNPDDLEQIVNTVLDEILQKDKYVFVLKNKQNSFVVKSLYGECKRIMEAFVYVNQHSKYKPAYFEMPFKNTSIFNKIYMDKDLSLVGIIDRVDGYENCFNVIDYKTGSSHFDDFTDIFYGKKLQLVVYLMSFSDNNLYIPTGAFYLPITNDFSLKDGKDKYKLKGIINKETACFENFDDRLSSAKYNSDIVSIGTDKDGKIKTKNNYYNNLCLTNSEQETLFKFVVEKLRNGAVQILEGTITPAPLKLDNRCECDYCKYKGLCNFNPLYQNDFVNMEAKPNVASLFGVGCNYD